jgi:hypothetical protein
VKKVELRPASGSNIKTRAAALRQERSVASTLVGASDRSLGIVIRSRKSDLHVSLLASLDAAAGAVWLPISMIWALDMMAHSPALRRSRRHVI